MCNAALPSDMSAVCSCLSMIASLPRTYVPPQHASSVVSLVQAVHAAVVAALGKQRKKKSHKKQKQQPEQATLLRAAALGVRALVAAVDGATIAPVGLVADSDAHEDNKQQALPWWCMNAVACAPHATSPASVAALVEWQRASLVLAETVCRQLAPGAVAAKMQLRASGGSKAGKDTIVPGAAKQLDWLTHAATALPEAAGVVAGTDGQTVHSLVLSTAVVRTCTACVSGLRQGLLAAVATASHANKDAATGVRKGDVPAAAVALFKAARAAEIAARAKPAAWAASEIGRAHV